MFRVLALIFFVAAAGAAQSEDWPLFGYDLASSGASAANTGITASNARSLARRQVRLPGTVDASVIYLQAAEVKGAAHDAFFATTSYGKTLAIDANNGAILWEYAPPKYDSWARTAQITNSTPAADPDRRSIYAAAPDGTVSKLSVADGHAEWTTPISLLPQREKIASPLKVFRGRVIAVTGGYIGDRPPYQGHVAILDAQSGKLLHVWNSLCSDRAGLMEPKTCGATRSAIWGRAGAVIDASGNIFVATGNGPYNGKTNWGDSVIELDADATHVLANYTPSDNREIEVQDLDLGSTSPALLGGDVLAQGGKEALIRLVSIKAISGMAAHVNHELQTVPTPSHGMMFTAAAVWRRGGETWLFAADFGGTEAWRLNGDRLTHAWGNATAGTSPIVAGGLLYVYDPRGALHIYDPASGTQVASLPCGHGHWNSPIAIHGKIALPEGNANQHATAGVMDIWSVGETRSSTDRRGEGQ